MGYQVAEKMKQEDVLMVTILITGWELKKEAPRLSPFDFQIAKPFTAEQIEKVVGRALNLYDIRVLKSAEKIAVRAGSWRQSGQHTRKAGTVPAFHLLICSQLLTQNKHIQTR